MNNFKLKYQAAFALALLIICTLASGDDDRRDGNWWRTQKRNARISYAVGFYDGITLGHNFSVWKYLSNGTKTEQDGVAQARKSFVEYSRKYLYNVTTGQLVDGLDNFYADYRNRRIMVHDAVWLVVNAIAGTPQDELNKMTESWRKNSAN